VTRRLRVRDGFALLAVLWMLGGGAALGALLMLSTRHAQQVAINRVGLARARWIAEGCVERARVAVDEWTGARAIDDSVWAHLDRIVRASPLTRGCDLAIVPAGTTLDVNRASDAALRRLFTSAGLSATAADSLVDAVLDWRDADDDPRVSGAERRWYETARRIPPRNADVASAEELATIRGLEARPEIASMLGTAPGRIVLSHAPLPVLATLPGITPAALAELERRRAVGDSVIDVVRLGAVLDSAASSSLLAQIAALNELATPLPDAWLIAARASDGGTRALSARLELRVVRSGRRLAILGRRSDS
jgi:type II secretory pathway component PulK